MRTQEYIMRCVARERTYEVVNRMTDGICGTYPYRNELTRSDAYTKAKLRMDTLNCPPEDEAQRGSY